MYISKYFIVKEVAVILHMYVVKFQTVFIKKEKILKTRKLEAMSINYYGLL